MGFGGIFLAGKTFAAITLSVLSVSISSSSALLASTPLLPLAGGTHNLALASPSTWQVPRAARGAGKRQQMCCRSVPAHICVGLFLSLHVPCQKLGCCCLCMPRMMFQGFASSSWAARARLLHGGLLSPAAIQQHLLSASCKHGEAVKTGLTWIGHPGCQWRCKSAAESSGIDFSRSFLQRGQRLCAKISRVGSWPGCKCRSMFVQLFFEPPGVFCMLLGVSRRIRTRLQAQLPQRGNVFLYHSVCLSLILLEHAALFSKSFCWDANSAQVQTVQLQDPNFWHFNCLFFLLWLILPPHINPRPPVGAALPVLFPCR